MEGIKTKQADPGSTGLKAAASRSELWPASLGMELDYLILVGL